LSTALEGDGRDAPFIAADPEPETPPALNNVLLRIPLPGGVDGMAPNPDPPGEGTAKGFAAGLGLGVALVGAANGSDTLMNGLLLPEAAAGCCARGANGSFANGSFTAEG
tara:strand:+ start:390 stop:719 length:330 start_codon:yes stop_codon:yes gene_type:complete